MRILFVCDYWGTGGIERFTTNAAIGLAERGHSCTVYSPVDSGKSPFDSILEQHDVKRESSLIREGGGASVALYRTGVSYLAEQLAETSYDVIHVNAMNSMSLLFDWVAKRNNIPVRVAHSHNSSLKSGRRSVHAAVHAVGRRGLGGCANVRLACSEDAGGHLFGNKNFEVLRNGIDTGAFAFDPAERHAVRESLGVQPTMPLVGNIGRLEAAKNPLFHVDIAERLASLMPKGFRYMIAGEGAYAKRLDDEIARRGLEGYFIRLPFVTKPEAFLSALDAFVMPSLFEGLPIALSEAQCSGLPAFASSSVTEESSFTDLVSFVPLESGASGWAKLIATSLTSLKTDLRGRYEIVAESSEFSMRGMCEKLERIYQIEGIGRVKAGRTKNMGTNACGKEDRCA